MSSQSDDVESHRTRAERLLLQIREEVIMIRSRYRSERAKGGVTPQTEEALRDIAIEYYEALREHRNEEVIKKEWTDGGIEELERLLEETTVVDQETPGHGTRSKPVEVPRIQQVDPEVLVHLTRKMDDVCKKLGFSPPVNESTPRTNIDNELVEEVEKWRQKNLE